MAFTIKSLAFADGSPIPQQHTCDGRNISPSLEWQDPPAGTREFALILDDPDAPRGVYTHWVLYGLPANVQSLPEWVRTGESGPEGSKQGRNSAGETGYSGPCPPPGRGAHHYVFNLYALDAPLNLRPGESKESLLQAMGGHIVAVAQTTGLYERRSTAEEPKGSARG